MINAMHEWTTEQVKWFLDRAPVATRTRLSSSNGIARVDIYHRDGEYPRKLITELEGIGWLFGASHDGMPRNVCGYFYVHKEISKQVAAATRDIVKAMLVPAPDWRVRERDQAGWIVPRKSTRARTIYDMAKEGQPIASVAKAVRLPPSHVRAELGRIRGEPIPGVIPAADAPRPKAEWSEPTLVELRPWSTPEVELIWWTPVVDPAPEVAGGWACIGFVEDLPTVGRIVVAGEDHGPMVVQRIAGAQWFPYQAKRGRYRWDLFDWWRPLAEDGNKRNVMLAKETK